MFKLCGVLNLNIKFRTKILLILFSIAGLFFGTYGFSFAYGMSLLCEGMKRSATDVRVYDDFIILDLLRRDDEEELRSFWFGLIDSDDVMLLDHFLAFVEYGDKNYYLHLVDDVGRSSYAYAVEVGSQNVAEYMLSLYY